MSRRRRGERAVSMVEFCVVAPLFLLLVVLILDFGRAIYVKNTLDAAAREGARRAVLNNAPTSAQVESVIHGHSSDVSLANPCAYTTPAAPAAGDTGLIYLSAPPGGDSSASTPGCTVPATVSGHAPIKVTIVYRYEPMTPLLASVLGGGIVFESTSTMTTEY